MPFNFTKFAQALFVFIVRDFSWLRESFFLASAP
jgi:hypothetical protein